MASDVVSQGTDALTAIGNALSYTWGNCTRWVAENLSWIPGGWGDAWQWFGHAQQQGFQTVGPTLSPPPGSVAVWGPSLPGSGGAGHVAEVLGPSSTGFLVSEENWLGLGRTDIRNVTTPNNLLGFILPPNGVNVPVVGGLVQGAQGALTTAGAIASLPTSIGHGLANATAAGGHDLGVFFRNNIVALLVALVVAIVLFGGRG